MKSAVSITAPNTAACVYQVVLSPASLVASGTLRRAPHLGCSVFLVLRHYKDQ